MSRPDARVVTAPPDAAVVGPTCGGTAIDVGVPSDFTAGDASYFSSGFSDFFVLRDSGGLYAMSAICTHEGCGLQQVSNYLYCPCHGAKFSLSGTVTRGPAVTALRHYAMCVLPGGHVGVYTDRTTTSSDRLAV